MQKAETAVGPGHLPRGDDAFVFQGKVGWVTGDKETRQLSLHFVDRELVRPTTTCSDTARTPR